jgi:hypothetical protein
MTGVPYRSRPRPPFGWDIRDEDVLSLNDDEIEHALDVAQRQRLSFTPTLANFSLRLSASDPERFPPSEASQVLHEYWADAWDLVVGRIRCRPSLRPRNPRRMGRGLSPEFS